MKPSRADLTFYHARRAERAPPQWARDLCNPARHKGGRTAADFLNDAINERAGLKRAKRMEWDGTLSLLRLVRANQARGPYRAPYGEPEPRTLAGYMLDALMRHGTGYHERKPYYRRILARMPHDVLERGITDFLREG